MYLYDVTLMYRASVSVTTNQSTRGESKRVLSAIELRSR